MPSIAWSRQIALVATAPSRRHALAEVRTKSGTLSTDFLFTGEQFDAKARLTQGLYYLRARYHDPSIGRFGSDSNPRLPSRESGTLS